MTPDEPQAQPAAPQVEAQVEPSNASSPEPLQPGDLVKIGAEQPLRMAAITGSRLGSDGPAPPARRSAVAPYEAPVSFDWRNRPLDGGGGRGRS